MNIRIFLRAIVYNGENCLEMYDSKGQKGINDLTTIADPGDTIHWMLDRDSGIDRINRILGKRPGARIFREDPSPANGEFVLHLHKDINRGLTGDLSEKYDIECTLQSNKQILKIDPYIKIPPP